MKQYTLKLNEIVDENKLKDIIYDLSKSYSTAKRWGIGPNKMTVLDVENCVVEMTTEEENSFSDIITICDKIYFADETGIDFKFIPQLPFSVVIAKKEGEVSIPGIPSFNVERGFIIFSEDEQTPFAISSGWYNETTKELFIYTLVGGEWKGNWYTDGIFPVQFALSCREDIVGYVLEEEEPDEVDCQEHLEREQEDLAEKLLG